MTVNHPNTSYFFASSLKSLILGTLAIAFCLGCPLTREAEAGDPLDKSSPKIAHGMYRDRGKSSPKIAHGIRGGDGGSEMDRDLFELNTAMLMALELGQWEIAAEIFNELKFFNR